MARLLPPGKSGMSAIFPAIKYQERGPETGITLLFVFSQEILLTKHDTCRTCRPANGKNHFLFCQTDHCLPTQACAGQNSHAADPCFSPADIPGNTIRHGPL